MLPFQRLNSNKCLYVVVGDLSKRNIFTQSHLKVTLGDKVLHTGAIV